MFCLTLYWKWVNLNVLSSVAVPTLKSVKYIIQSIRKRLNFLFPAQTQLYTSVISWYLEKKILRKWGRHSFFLCVCLFLFVTFLCHTIRNLISGKPENTLALVSSLPDSLCVSLASTGTQVQSKRPRSCDRLLWLQQCSKPNLVNGYI